MTRQTDKSRLFPLGSGVIAFAVTLLLTNSTIVGTWRHAAGDEERRLSSGTFPRKEEAISDRNFVMHVLQSRRLQPERNPEEWMQFLASLDAWYRSSRVDCITTLTSGSFHSILRLVDQPRTAMASPELLTIARQANDARTQLDAYQELWRRATQKGLQDCTDLIASMPAVYQPLFRDRLLKMWVDSRGVQSLAEIAAVPFLSASDVEDAFRLCAKADPDGCLAYLGSESFKSLQKQFGSSLMRRGAFLTEACAHLPPERALSILEIEPPTTGRDANINSIVLNGVANDPKIAQEMIARYPHRMPQVAGAAYLVAYTKPKSSAAIVNMVPGEQLRTSTARKIALRLPAKEADEFIGALSEPLTQATVRAAVDKLRKPRPEAGLKQ